MNRFLVAVVAIAGAGCLAKDVVTDADTTAALVQELLTDSPYTGWGTWPSNANNPEDFTKVLDSAGPHTRSVKIHVNKVGLAAVDTFDGTLPDGTIVVKAGWKEAPADVTDETVPVSILAMKKISGYDPGSGDWFWLQVKPDGSEARGGKDEFCANCHGVTGHHDYQLRFGFSSVPAVPSLAECDAAPPLDHAICSDELREKK